MTQILQTNRLIIRQLTLEDAPFILQLLNTPGWLKYIGDRNVRSLEQAENYIQNGPLISYAQHGFGLWLVTLKETSIPIGMSGLLKRDTLDFPDIGFAFLPDFGKFGYARESADAIINFARSELKINELLAVTQPNNEASIGLLIKLGFQYKQPFSFPDDMNVLNLYELQI
jgi:ribosomal-protein-alanine N-acetyltransferase